mgnify:CR=1 FL=1
MGWSKFRKSPQAVVRNELPDLEIGLLGDVDGTIAPSAGELLRWNATTGQWTPSNANFTWDDTQVEITGNLVVSGTITANAFHVTYVTSSVLMQSGSTVFGNTTGDIHQFTGSVYISNNLSASLFNSGQLTASISSLGSAITTGISSSGVISASYFYGDGSNLTNIGSAGHTIQDEGSNLTARTYLNFVGAGVTVTDDSGNDTTRVTISAGSGETNTASNEGSGIGLAMAKSNSNLPFKTLVAGANIGLTADSNTITVAYNHTTAAWGEEPAESFTAGVRILSGTGIDLVAGGLARLFITGSGYVGINVTGSSVTHRLTLPNSSTGNDGKAVAYAWSTYSSRRFKEEIRTIDNPIGIIEGLRGVRYKWRDSQKDDIGFIAEEVGELVPEVVDFEADGKNAKGMNYARLTSILVEAVKAQQKRIDELEKLIKD